MKPVGRMQNYIILNLVVHKVTMGLQKISCHAKVLLSILLLVWVHVTSRRKVILGGIVVRFYIGQTIP
jgi:hypothetical protein